MAPPVNKILGWAGPLGGPNLTCRAFSIAGKAIGPDQLLAPQGPKQADSSLDKIYLWDINWAGHNLWA